MTHSTFRIPLLIGLVLMTALAVWLWEQRAAEVSPQGPSANAEWLESERPSSELIGMQREASSSSRKPVPPSAPEPNASKATEPVLGVEAPEGKANFEFHLSMQLVDAEGLPIRNRRLQIGYGLKEHIAHVPVTHTIPFLETTDDEGRIVRPIPFSSESLVYIAMWAWDPETTAKAWVDPVEIAPDADVDLGSVPLLQVRERFPVPWVAGRILNENRQPLERVHGILNESAFYEFDAGEEVGPKPLEWPGWFGTQFVFEPNGHFAAYGPPGLNLADLSFSSDGYESEHLIAIEVPNLDLQVELAKQLWLRGKLLVPAAGPPVQEYGVWLSQGDRGTGVRAQANGEFAGPGTSRSLRLQITHPSMGHVLYNQEFLSAPNEEAGLGTVDLTQLVQVIDVRLVDSSHKPHAKVDLHMEAEGVQSNGGQYQTDAEGRLWTVLPLDADAIRLGRMGMPKAEVKLSELGPTLVLP